MSVNLFDLLSSQVGGEVLRKIGGFLGESEANTQSAVNSGLSTILGGLMNKASTPSGAGDLFELLNRDKHDGGILDNLLDLVGGGNSTSGLISMGGPILKYLFGNKLGGIFDLISGGSGISGKSATSLLSMLAPIVLGMLGKQKNKLGLDAFGLAKLLLGQKDIIKKYAPAGLAGLLGLNSFDSLADNMSSNFASAGGGRKTETSSSTSASSGGGSSLLKTLLPLLALLLVAFLLFPYIRGCSKKAVDETANASEATREVLKDAANATGNAVKDAANATGNAVKGAAEATGDAASAAAEKVKGVLKSITLPGGHAIKSAADSFEDKVATFLAGKETDLSKAYYTFDNLHFETGSAKLKPESEGQLNNLTAIMKAYPKVHIRLDGHTDNTGDAAKNKALSKQRANAVKAQLVKKGIDAKRIDTRGYGDAKPIASNDTDAGRAQNRRLDVVITKR